MDSLPIAIIIFSFKLFYVWNMHNINGKDAWTLTMVIDVFPDPILL